MAKNDSNRYLEIIRQIRAKEFKPIYFLMGEESYFIDLITDEIIANVLNDDERDFNQTIMYGADVAGYSAVVGMAKRFPMMASRQLVVVKEAQQINDIDLLHYYIAQPLMSTILVINYKNGSLKNKKLLSELEKTGVVYESKKLYENQLIPFITAYVQEKKLTIDIKAAQMLADFIGNDLVRLTGELDKLQLSMGADAKHISPELVETCVGVSKDFNNFELVNALAARDIYKANQIVNYFESNPKNNPFAVTISVLFAFFANLMICYYASDKSERGIMQELGLRVSFQARNYILAMRNYNAYKCVEIIELLRQYDARSKGIGSTSNISEGALLRELVYKIMH